MSQKVIVIGGGYAGIEAAAALDSKFEVTLVAGGETFRHIVAGIRSSVLPENTPRILPPYDKLLRRGIVKKCLATRIDAAACTVTIATGETLLYDFLILATGILHPKTVGMGGGTSTVADQTAVFLKANEELKAAKDILIVGGGPIGIETAGEIMEEMPGKTVTLVTSKELMPSSEVAFPQKFRTRLSAKLKSTGVMVHTDVGHVSYNPADIDECGFIVGRKTYTWTGGEIEADMCIVATGMRQTRSLYADSGLESWLDDKGLVMVERTMEVKGANSGGKVFAVGDCIDLPVPKVAYLAGTEGTAVAKQVVASAAGKPLKDITPVPQAVSLVPVGKRGGVSALPMGIVVGDFMTRNIKSKDMFTSKYWATLHAGKPPPTP